MIRRAVPFRNFLSVINNGSNAGMVRIHVLKLKNFRNMLEFNQDIVTKNSEAIAFAAFSFLFPQSFSYLCSTERYTVYSTGACI